MTDQHAHAGYVGHGGYLNGSSGHGGDSAHTGSFDVDPLFGTMQGHARDTYADQNGYATGHSGQFDTGAYTSAYDTTGQWTVPPQATPYEPSGATGQFDTRTFGTGQFDTGAFTTPAFPAQSTGTGAFDTGAFDMTGQWDASAWTQAQDTGQYDNSAFATAHDTTGQWTVPGMRSDTGTYDATAWNATATTTTAFPEPVTPEPDPEPEPQLAYETAEFAALEPEPEAEYGYEYEYEPESGPDASGPDVLDAPSPAPAGSRAEARRGAGRRRRSPAKRSALLTVAVPSVCVMGVAGVAVASVGGFTGGKDDSGTVTAASDPASVKPVAANTKLDTQLANLSADANGFADRASRTQERLDLKARQDAEKRKKDDAAAAKEAARPKFVLPVTQKGLSAYYGQAGVNWMSVHTGIDFPVDEGTPVMSAIDGTVRTQWNSAYGNMAIVTGDDGTETWYCHLSSTKVRSGKVKAGDVIAYSGDTGNSTGPHLHFEVRPNGGTSIDPLPWLRSHGLNPT
ncbi:M23 family metallopeptidase [Streptomyces sp. NPDC052000]|uniref:M23 family metallopeptidase n=1 Tax=Streptomyces sp. NPDC052000 TaxID=3155676 RepID=UPI0034507FE0